MSNHEVASDQKRQVLVWKPSRELVVVEVLVAGEVDLAELLLLALVHVEVDPDRRFAERLGLEVHLREVVALRAVEALDPARGSRTAADSRAWSPVASVSASRILSLSMFSLPAIEIWRTSGFSSTSKTTTAPASVGSRCALHVAEEAELVDLLDVLRDLRRVERRAGLRADPAADRLGVDPVVAAHRRSARSARPAPRRCTAGSASTTSKCTTTPAGVRSVRACAETIAALPRSVARSERTTSGS